MQEPDSWVTGRESWLHLRAVTQDRQMTCHWVLSQGAPFPSLEPSEPWGETRSGTSTGCSKTPLSKLHKSSPDVFKFHMVEVSSIQTLLRFTSENTVNMEGSNRVTSPRWRLRCDGTFSGTETGLSMWDPGHLLGILPWPQVRKLWEPLSGNSENLPRAWNGTNMGPGSVQGLCFFPSDHHQPQILVGLKLEIRQREKKNADNCQPWYIHTKPSEKKDYTALIYLFF